MLRTLLWSILLLIVAPIAASGAISYSSGWPASWRQADWQSTGTLPPPRAEQGAVIRVYAARSGRWKGIFAVHHWLVVKQPGGSAYERYEVVGWGTPLRRNNYPADGRWYSNEPRLVFELHGEKAARLLPKVEAAIAAYEHGARGGYRVWPGPNSNTFVAYVLRSVPELGAEMDSAGVGKDYLGPGFQLARTPSGTGWQVSIGGYAGAAAAWREGIELHLLGATIGIDPDDLAVKLPALGDLGLRSIFSRG